MTVKMHSNVLVQYSTNGLQIKKLEQKKKLYPPVAICIRSWMTLLALSDQVSSSNHGPEIKTFVCNYVSSCILKKYLT